MPNREIIIPSEGSLEPFPSGLQELYLTMTEEGSRKISEKLTEKNLKLLLRKIHHKKTMEAYLWWNSDEEGDFFNIETNPDWIAFQYVFHDGMEDGCFYSCFNPAYLDSEEESETGTFYGCFMPLRYTMYDPKLAAKCVEYFARTGKLYPGTAWLKESCS